MKDFARTFILLGLFAAVATGQTKQNSGSEALRHLGKMRVAWNGFDEVTNPETKQKEFVFYVKFLDIPIPKQPLHLRKGDKVAGYIIGSFTKREPIERPNDGIVAGTDSTLELIHEESGQKYMFVPGQISVVERDP